MLYYDRIDISKRIDPTKSKNSKKMFNLPLLFFNKVGDSNIDFFPVNFEKL